MQEIVIKDIWGVFIFWIALYLILGVVRHVIQTILFKVEKKKESYQGKISWNRVFVAVLLSGVLLLLGSNNISLAFGFDSVGVILIAFVFIGVSIIIFYYKIRKGVSKN